MLSRVASVQVSAAITAAAANNSNQQLMRLLPTLSAAQSPAALRAALVDGKAQAIRQLAATLDRLQEVRSRWSLRYPLGDIHAAFPVEARTDTVCSSGVSFHRPRQGWDDLVSDLETL